MCGRRSTSVDTLISGFFLVSKRQDINRIVQCIDPIKRHVPGAAEWNHQLAQFRQILQGSPHVRFVLHQLKPALNGLGGITRS